MSSKCVKLEIPFPCFRISRKAISFQALALMTIPVSPSGRTRLQRVVGLDILGRVEARIRTDSRFQEQENRVLKISPKYSLTHLPAVNVGIC